ALNPNHAESYHLRAHVYEHLGQFAKAIDDFSEAIQRQPNNAHLHDARGHNYLRRNEHAQAAADLQKSLELNPHQSNTCNTLAWLLVVGPKELRNGNKAVLYAERAVQLDPTNWLYHNTLGLALYRADRYQDAITPLAASLKGNNGRTDGF